MRLRKEPLYIHELDTAEGQLGGKFYDYNAPAHSGLARRFVGKKKKKCCVNSTIPSVPCLRVTIRKVISLTAWSGNDVPPCM